jgi:hypothetical protein
MDITKKHLLVLILLLISIHGFCQLNLGKFSSRIVMVAPDKLSWTKVRDDLSADNSKGVLMFKHQAFTDSKGRTIEPVIALTYQKTGLQMTTKEYSTMSLAGKQFKPTHELLGGYPEYSSDGHSLVYNVTYVRDDIKHSVIIGYICFKGIGVEIVGDATEEIFPKVKSDIMMFLKSVRVKD